MFKFKTLLSKFRTNPPPPAKPRAEQQFYDNYFSLIAAGARLKLVEAMFNLKLFALFAEKPCLLESEIIVKLELMPLRAKKWLYLLSCEKFLLKTQIEGQTAYRLPEEFIRLIKSD